MKTPHKHAELIKAWADGAEIEFSFAHDIWHSIPREPERNIPNCMFRIKPEPKPDVVHTVKVRASGFCIFNSVTGCVSEANLKLTFSGETGKLKSAEVI